VFKFIVQASILLLSPFFSKLILQVQIAPQEFVTGMLLNTKVAVIFYFILFFLTFCSKLLIMMILDTGLAIFSCMPTTLSSGVALTQVLHEPFFFLLYPIVLSASIMIYA
jgi:sodium/bile acid cotransporter 7